MQTPTPIEIISLAFALVGTIVSFIALYLTSLKRGKILALPIKFYRVTGWMNQGERCLELILPLTFMNTGTFQRAINDIRVCVSVPGQQDELILHWMLELDNFSFSTRDEDQGRHFPNQPTLNSYESLSRTYAFISRRDDAKIVETIEQKAKEMENVEQIARIDIRSGSARWRALSTFKIHYDGRIYTETDYERINL